MFFLLYYAMYAAPINRISLLSGTKRWSDHYSKRQTCSPISHKMVFVCVSAKKKRQLALYVSFKEKHLCSVQMVIMANAIWRYQ